MQDKARNPRKAIDFWTQHLANHLLARLGLITQVFVTFVAQNVINGNTSSIFLQIYSLYIDNFFNYWNLYELLHNQN